MNTSTIKRGALAISVGLLIAFIFLGVIEYQKKADRSAETVTLLPSETESSVVSVTIPENRPESQWLNKLMDPASALAQKNNRKRDGARSRSSRLAKKFAKNYLWL